MDPCVGSWIVDQDFVDRRVVDWIVDRENLDCWFVIDSTLGRVVGQGSSFSRVLDRVILNCCMRLGRGEACISHGSRIPCTDGLLADHVTWTGWETPNIGHEHQLWTVTDDRSRNWTSGSRRSSFSSVKGLVRPRTDSLATDGRGIGHEFWPMFMTHVSGFCHSSLKIFFVCL